eukprot:360019-Chlamydomonas_euryale.AAC.6
MRFCTVRLDDANAEVELGGRHAGDDALAAAAVAVAVAVIAAAGPSCSARCKQPTAVGAATAAAAIQHASHLPAGQ